MKPHDKALGKAKGGKKEGSMLRFMLGKTEQEMHDSGSHRAIYGKDGKVKRNINQ
jgi:hypothetical protein